MSEYFSLLQGSGDVKGLLSAVGELKVLQNLRNGNAP